MADIENGFMDLAGELEVLSEKITNEATRRKALEEGAKPIVNRAKQIMSSHRRTGRLDEAISSAYNETDQKQDIGIGGQLNTTKLATGFYGRFLDRGYHPVRIIGTREKSRFSGTINVTERTGKFVKIPFLAPALEAERENMQKAMIEVYQKEAGG